MYIKFKEKLSQYKYLVMFDLATWVTGICCWDIKNSRPMFTKVLKINHNVESPVFEQYKLIADFFKELAEQIDLKQVLVYKEAMPIQAGRFTTIQTLIALARSHAVLDLFLVTNNIATYDNIGVYPASTRAYFKKVGDCQDKHEEKQDINKYVVQKYNLDPITLDESDAIFLAETFINVKWNKDIDEEIRDVKRHKKQLKANHAIQECDNKITFLLSLKV